MSAVHQGETLWRPSRQKQVETSNLTRYLRWLEAERGLRFAGLQRAVALVGGTDLEAFWGSIADWFDIRFPTPSRSACSRTARCPARSWFPGARLNYAEQALARRRPRIGTHLPERDGNERREFSRDDLRREVGAARAGLLRLGVGSAVIVWSPTFRTRRKPRSRFPRHRESGCDLVELSAGVRGRERPRPLPSDRAEGPDRRRSVRLQRSRVRP